MIDEHPRVYEGCEERQLDSGTVGAPPMPSQIKSSPSALANLCLGGMWSATLGSSVRQVHDPERIVIRACHGSGASAGRGAFVTQGRSGGVLVCS